MGTTFSRLEVKDVTENIQKNTQDIGGNDDDISALIDAQAGGGVAFKEETDAQSNLNYDNNQKSEIYLDPDPTKNGVYQKVGASGVGNWVKIAELGATSTAHADLKSKTASGPVNDEIWGISGDNGLALKMMGDGSLHTRNINTDKINNKLTKFYDSLLPKVYLIAERFLIPSAGQSLAQGNGAGVLSAASSFFDALRFNANGTVGAGPRAQDGTGTVAQNHASLVAYKEELKASSGNGETIVGTCIRQIKQMLIDENNILPSDYEYVPIGCANGQSNTAIDGLKKGTVSYQHLIDDVTYGESLSRADGKTFAVPAVLWSQGERDIDLGTTRAAYKAALIQLVADYNTDIKAITGQVDGVKIIMYQCQTWNQGNTDVALAQLEAAQEDSRIILIAPIYGFQHTASNNPHLKREGYSELGALDGYAWKRVLIDGQEVLPFAPKSIQRHGNILNVRFDKPFDGKMVLGDYLFPDATNSGFDAINDVEVANAITAVEVVGPDTVKITLTNAESGTLRYGEVDWAGNLYLQSDDKIHMARDRKMTVGCCTFSETFN